MFGVLDSVWPLTLKVRMLIHLLQYLLYTSVQDN